MNHILYNQKYAKYKHKYSLLMEQISSNKIHFNSKIGGGASGDDVLDYYKRIDNYKKLSKNVKENDCNKIFKQIIISKTYWNK